MGIRTLVYTRYAWAGGTIFPVVLLCQYLVLVGNRFWFYIQSCYTYWDPLCTALRGSHYLEGSIN
jgi:hypothetical protein